MIILKKKSSAILFFITIIIGLSYSFLPYTGLSNSILSLLGTVWNLLLTALAGYFLLKTEFLSQFKHFSFKVLLWGIPLIMISGILFSSIYASLFGKPTTNSIGETISLAMIFLQIPFMLLGEELLSTNILLALQTRGLSFFWSTIICSLLFAMWHIPAYGFHPLQLLITLMPARLALNYIWKKSDSIWVSWICHFVYDSLGFIAFFIK